MGLLCFPYPGTWCYEAGLVKCLLEGSIVHSSGLYTTFQIHSNPKILNQTWTTQEHWRCIVIENMKQQWTSVDFYLCRIQSLLLRVGVSYVEQRRNGGPSTDPGFPEKWIHKGRRAFETHLVVVTCICVNFILSFLLLRRLIKQSNSCANLFYKTKPKEMNRM